MTALTGLCTLGHFDLNLTGADQITAGDAKAPRGHLLNGRAAILTGSGGI